MGITSRLPYQPGPRSPSSPTLALLDLPGLIDRPDRQAAAPAGLASGLIQALHREPAHYPDRRRTVPDRRLSSRWVLSGVRSPACSAIVQPLRLGIWLTSAPVYLPACSHGSTRANTAATAAAAQPGSSGPGPPLSWRQQPPPILLS
jgi:hypothetical protein